MLFFDLSHFSDLSIGVEMFLCYRSTHLSFIVDLSLFSFIVWMILFTDFFNNHSPKWFYPKMKINWWRSHSTKFILGQMISECTVCNTGTFEKQIWSQTETVSHNISFSRSVSVDVEDAGGAPENRGASSSQTEGKAAVVEGVIV